MFAIYTMAVTPGYGSTPATDIPSIRTKPVWTLDKVLPNHKVFFLQHFPARSAVRATYWERGAASLFFWWLFIQSVDILDAILSPIVFSYIYLYAISINSTAK